MFPLRICQLDDVQWRNAQLFLEHNNPAQPTLESTWVFNKRVGDWHKTILLFQKMRLTLKREAQVIAFTACYILEHPLQEPVYTASDSLTTITQKKFSSKTEKTSTDIQNLLKLVPCPGCGGPLLIVLATSESLDEMRKWAIKWHKCARMRDQSNNETSASKKELKPSQPTRITPVELAQFLCKERTVVLTGAGLSVAAGIPHFTGIDGFETTLGFDGKDILADLFPQRLLLAPQEVIRARGNYTVDFITASPTYGHKILKIWEDLGIVSFIITTNADRLHHKAGSQKVIQIAYGHEIEQHLVEGTETWKRIDEATMMIVIGISRDAHGLIRYATDKKLKIVGISPNQPAYLGEGNFWICSDAQDTLKKVDTLLPCRKNSNTRTM